MTIEVYATGICKPRSDTHPPMKYSFERRTSDVADYVLVYRSCILGVPIEPGELISEDDKDFVDWQYLSQSQFNKTYAVITEEDCG